MEIQQTVSSTGVMNSISASHEPVSGQVVDSLPSTIRPYESSSSGPNDERQSPSDNVDDVVEADAPLVIDDSDGDQVAESSLRPRGAKVNRPDYTYRALLDSMPPGTTPEPSRRRKRKRGLVTNDMDDVASFFDNAYEKFRQHHYSMRDKIKKVEENLQVSNKDNEVLKQQNEELKQLDQRLKPKFAEVHQQNCRLEQLHQTSILKFKELKQRNEEWKKLYQKSKQKFTELQQQNEQLKQENKRHKDEIERLRETRVLPVRRGSGRKMNG